MIKLWCDKLAQYTESQIVGANNLAHNLVSVGEESIPLVKDSLVLVFEVMPFGNTVFRAEAGCCQGTGRILARVD